MMQYRHARRRPGARALGLRARGELPQRDHPRRGPQGHRPGGETGRPAPPDDGDGPDARLGVWAGTLPLTSAWGTPVSDPLLPPDIPIPGHIARREGTRHG